MLQVKQYQDISYKIIGAAMTVHNELRWGLLEPIYQESLHLELEDHGIHNDREQEIITHYKHHILEKKYKMDIVVGDIIVELKSVSEICAAHRAQLCNYLRLTNKPLGILINFGEEKLNAERWAYDKDCNECVLVDKNMNPVEDSVYQTYLDNILTDEEKQSNQLLY